MTQEKTQLDIYSSEAIEAWQKARDNGECSNGMVWSSYQTMSLNGLYAIEAQLAKALTAERFDSKPFIECMQALKANTQLIGFDMRYFGEVVREHLARDITFQEKAHISRWLRTSRHNLYIVPQYKGRNRQSNIEAIYL